MPRIFRPHAVGAVAEHIAEADRIVFCVFPRKPGPDTPHKAPGAALGRKGFVINQERTGKFQIAVQLAADGAFPAYHAGRTQSHGIAVPSDIIFRRVAVGAGHSKAPVKGKARVFMGFLENMKIIVVDEPPGIDAVHQVVRLDFRIRCLCMTDRLKDGDHQEREQDRCDTDWFAGQFFHKSLRIN